MGTDNAARPNAPWLPLVLLAGYLGVLALTASALQTLAPDRLSVSLFGHIKIFDHLHARLFSDLLTLFALTPLALGVEALVVGWERCSLRALAVGRTPSMDTDLAIFLLGQIKVLDVLGRILMLGASLISGAWLAAELKTRFGFEVSPRGLPFPAQVVLYFYVYSFFDYWTHRADHWWVFWPLHRYHHSATDFCVLSAERQHPASGLVGVFIINVPLAVLGASAEVMIWVNTAVGLLGLIIHSRIDADWGWAGRWLIQSPNGHRLHHKLDMSTTTGNYAIAPVWDRLFGTAVGEGSGVLAIGVEDPYRQHA